MGLSQKTLGAPQPGPPRRAEIIFPNTSGGPLDLQLCTGEVQTYVCFFMCVCVTLSPFVHKIMKSSCRVHRLLQQQQQQHILLQTNTLLFS